MKDSRRRIWMPLLALGFGVVVFGILTLSRADVEKPTSETPTKTVAVVEARKVDIRDEIPFTTEIKARAAYSLAARVSGRISHVHPSLYSGGFVNEGDVLLEIDDEDYRLRFEQERAILAIEEAELELELGRVEAARLEVEAYQKNGDRDDERLRLAKREPQLRQRQAKVRLQKSRVAKAQLDLERCTIFSPANCVVLERTVEFGDVVEASEVLARLALRGEYELEIRLSRSSLTRLDLRGSVERYSVRINNLDLEGRVVGYLGEVDVESRRSGVLVRVSAGLGAARLAVGEFVSGVIYGETHREVVSLPEECVREDSTVWIVSESGLLERRDVNEKRIRSGEVWIESGLEDGDRVVLGDFEGALGSTVAVQVVQVSW